MPGRVEGMVAHVTGAVPGQGRIHAVRLAQDGADSMPLDSYTHLDWAAYPMPPDHLAQTSQRSKAVPVCHG
jgi:hypothetical protein